MSLTLAACATTSHEIRVRQRTGAAERNPAAAAAHAGLKLMIDSATSMIGQPYRFGGAAPGGFDCSGLVVYAAANAGIRVPRTAAEQLQSARP